MIKKLPVLCAALFFTSVAFAGSFSWHIDAGPAWVSLQKKTQTITMYTDTVNQYNTNDYSNLQGLFELGVSYQQNYSHNIALNLGLNADYLRNRLSGVNTPLVNGGDFDTLNYSIEGESYALMLEPKIIWSAHSWEPYLLTGAGVSFNHFGDYSETPTDPSESAAPSTALFNSHTKTNLIVELGLGIQHQFSASQFCPLLFLEYKFMDWGTTGLSTYTGQPNNTTLDFGRLRSSSIQMGASWEL